MKLIVGLGNPGLKYKRTRHNVGFMAIDFLVEAFDKKAKWKKNTTQKLEQTQISINGIDYEFIKPLTYMNNSGQVVKLLTQKCNLQNSDIYIIHDELDLTLGDIRLKTSGSSAGHNGIKSIIQELNTDKFNRIRIGIKTVTANEKMSIPAEKFVLMNFSKTEREILKNKIFPEVKKIIFN